MDAKDIRSIVFELCKATENYAAKQIDDGDLSEIDRAYRRGYWRGRAQEARDIRMAVGALTAEALKE